MPTLPIKFQELVQLANVGVDTQSIGFNSCVCPTNCHQLLGRDKQGHELTRS